MFSYVSFVFLWRKEVNASMLKKYIRKSDWKSIAVIVKSITSVIVEIIKLFR